MSNRIAKSRRVLFAALLASSAAVAPQAPALAQDYPHSEANVTRFDIAAQPLSSALSDFARQSGLQVLYPYEALQHIQAPALHGAFAREDALRTLLANSGYRASVSGGAVQLEAIARPQQASADPDSQRSDTRAPQASQDSEIVVTGTRIRGAPPAGSNLTIIDRDAIDQTGRTSIQDVLTILPQDFPGSQNEATQLGASASGRNLAFSSTVDLRGLGADATLTLVNGHRLAPAGFGNFVDISTIPLAAVNRIEVLADGASAVYGSDAVAGVVNVILRDHFDGAETAVHYGAATQGDPTDFGASQLFGRSWTSGAAMIGYEHRERSALSSVDRPYSSTSDLRSRGGSDFSSTFSNPGNIVGIGDDFAMLAIPHGQDGAHLTEADLLDGVENKRPFNQGSSLLPAQTNDSVFASLHQDLTDRLRFYADGFAGRREGQSDRFQLDAFLDVPESNAYRQLNGLFPGQGDLFITYNMGADLGVSHLNTETKAVALAGGLTYDVGNDWTADVSVAYAHNDDHVALNNLFDDTSADLEAALASSDLDTAFNPFADGSNTNPAVLSKLTYSDLTDSDASIVTYTAKADGPLLALWGNQARAAFGVEHRVEDFELVHERRLQSGSTFEHYVPSASRTTDALFGEIALPLVGEQNHIPLVQAFALSASLRYERANDFGEATTPKIGVNWDVNDALRLRASWGQSFKAPQFQQLLGPVTGQFAIAPQVLDPFATDGSTGLLLLAGPDPNLKPERGEHWTAGFDFQAPFVPGLDFHATYFDIDFSNRIDDPGSIVEALAGAPGFEGALIRNPTQAQIDHYLALAGDTVGPIPPPGIEAIWDGRLTNLASLRVRGVDLSGAYDRDTAFGRVGVFANASLLLQYSTQSRTGPVPVDGLDTFFHPVDWRARAGVSWSRDGWGAALSASYVDNYRDKISVPERDIKSWTTWDFRLTRDLRTAEHPSGTAIALSVTNLFDRDPPFANNPIGYGFDAQAASPVGRFISLELKHTW